MTANAVSIQARRTLVWVKTKPCSVTSLLFSILLPLIPPSGQKDNGWKPERAYHHESCKSQSWFHGHKAICYWFRHHQLVSTHINSVITVQKGKVFAQTEPKLGNAKREKYYINTQTALHSWNFVRLTIPTWNYDCATSEVKRFMLNTFRGHKAQNVRTTKI